MKGKNKLTSKSNSPKYVKHFKCDVIKPNIQCIIKLKKFMLLYIIIVIKPNIVLILS